MDKTKTTEIKLTKWIKFKCFLLEHIPTVDGEIVPNPKSIFGSINASFASNVKCKRCGRQIMWITSGQFWTKTPF